MEIESLGDIESDVCIEFQNSSENKVRWRVFDVLILRAKVFSLFASTVSIFVFVFLHCLDFFRGLHPLEIYYVLVEIVNKLETLVKIESLGECMEFILTGQGFFSACS